MSHAADAANRPAVSRTIAFGFLATFMSSFGQTFLLGLFSPKFQAAVGIDSAYLGILYGAATLASGMLLFWAGGFMDRLPLSRAVGVTMILFTGGCLAAATTSSPLLLLGAFFLLRLGGQGLLTHLAIVAAARGGGDRRGTTIAWASMGVIFGEAVLPALIIAGFELMPWRWMWGGVAILLLTAVLPTLLLLGRGVHWRTQPHHEHAPAATIHQRRSLLVRPSFWAGLSILVAAPFMATGFLFELSTFADQMGWQAGQIGLAFTVFAVCRGLGSWGFGRLADSLGAIALARVHLLPMALAFASLALPLGGASIWLAFAGIGFSNGANSVMGGAVWAELYGTASLGLVKGVSTACMVVSTALAPAIVAGALSAGITAEALGLAFAGYAALIPLVAVNLLRPQR